MKNKDLILMLVDKSANAYGQLIGLTESTKLKVALTIIQDTIKTAFGIDPNLLTEKALDDILVNDQLDIDQTRLLTNLLWAQAEILFKLNHPIESLINYGNTLHLLQWQTQHTLAKNRLERQNKIIELNSFIDMLKLTNEEKNKMNVCS